VETKSTVAVRATINGEERAAEVDPRLLLVEAIRDVFGLKGTHIGCLTGDCGACTVVVDGRIAKSCLMLAASADGREIVTVEGLAQNGELHPIQQSFWDEYGFQCGYCLPGMMFSVKELLEANPSPDEAEIRHALQGNLCRCTGYQKIVQAVGTAAERMSGGSTSNGGGRT
jgi:aerobic carbon-monoxide dehydrogenase small subunit